MQQLMRAIRADRKSIDIKRLYKVIRNGESASDMGDCRYVLDGNTLNLVIEEINKESK